MALRTKRDGWYVVFFVVVGLIVPRTTSALSIPLSLSLESVGERREIPIEELSRIDSIQEWMRRASEVQIQERPSPLDAWTHLSRNDRLRMIRNVPIHEFLCAIGHERHFTAHPETITRSMPPSLEKKDVERMMISTGSTPAMFKINIVARPNEERDKSLSFVAFNNMDGNRRAVALIAAAFMKESSLVKEITCGMLEDVVGSPCCDVLINGYTDSERNWQRHEAWVPKNVQFRGVSGDLLVNHVLSRLDIVDAGKSIALKPTVPYDDPIFESTFAGRTIGHVARAVLREISGASV